MDPQWHNFKSNIVRSVSNLLHTDKGLYFINTVRMVSTNTESSNTTPIIMKSAIIQRINSTLKNRMVVMLEIN